MTHQPPVDQSFATLTRSGFEKFSEFITRELGIKMPPEKLPMLQSRLQRRLRILEMDSLEAYQEYLFKSPGSGAEWIEFINLATTNKTEFFREARHFDYLAQVALPDLASAKPPGWKLKLWCAGCSSGEEAYTLAMVLSQFKDQRRDFDFSILATDISTNVLDRAREAIYDEALVGPVPMELRRRYLLRSKDREMARVRIAPQLRQKIQFERLNFMAPSYEVREDFDVIFFRNVMIYFDKPTQNAVLLKLCRHLKVGGYLFVGHAESIIHFDLPLKNATTSAFVKIK